MVAHLQVTCKIQDKVTYSSTIYSNFLKVDKLRFLVGVSVLNSQKLIWLNLFNSSNLSSSLLQNLKKFLPACHRESACLLPLLLLPPNLG